jgi:hypothetical protein
VFKLWAVAAALGLIYLTAWGVIKGTHSTPAPSPSASVQSDSSHTSLAAQATGDAVGRVDSRAQLKTETVRPKRFTGSDLHEAALTDRQAQTGFEIVIGAYVDKKLVSRLTYHAVAPSTVVFVKQEAGT